MRDSNGGGQNPLYIEAALEQGTSRVAQGGGADATLSGRGTLD